MLALSLDVFNSAYILFGYYKDFPHFTGITYGFPFIYGPVFYIYARLISFDNNDFKIKYLLHFIPFILVFIYGMIFVYFRGSDFKLALISNQLQDPLPGLMIIHYFKPVHGIIYVLLTVKVVRAYNKKIKDSYSNLEKINLNWLLVLTIGLSFVWVVVIVDYFATMFFPGKTELDYFIYIAVSILIYAIGYFSLLRPQLFGKISEKEPEVPPSTKTEESRTVYQKSGLTEVEAKNYQEKLLNYMENDKPYLDSDLTMRALASKLSISPHNLSEILNTRLNQNFYDFINRYRVEEVKRKLTSEESSRFNLIGIAFDSGFKSKSGFNTIFKKVTNMTPSQFREQAMENVTQIR